MLPDALDAFACQETLEVLDQHTALHTPNTFCSSGMLLDDLHLLLSHLSDSYPDSIHVTPKYQLKAADRQELTPKPQILNLHHP